jgi:hypothetical protein
VDGYCKHKAQLQFISDNVPVLANTDASYMYFTGSPVVTIPFLHSNKSCTMVQVKRSTLVNTMKLLCTGDYLLCKDNNIFRMFRNVLLLVLVVCFSILHKAVSFSIRVFDGSLLLYILCWAAILFVMYGMLLLARVKRSSAALIAACAGLFLLHFSDLQDALTGFSKFIGSAWFLFGVFFMGILLIVVIGKKGREPRRFNNYLFILLIVLNLVEAGRTIVTLSSKNRLVIKPAPVPAGPVAAKPGIYYLMFDSYTSNAVLQKHWGFSNDSITTYLRNRSFTVSDSARSLYDFTPAAVISAFNFDTLQLSGRTTSLSPDVATFNVLRREFRDNRLFSFLAMQGYDIRVHSMLEEENNLNGLFPFVPEEPLHWLRRRTIEKLWLNPSMFQKLRSLTGSKDTVPPRIRRSTLNMHRYNRDVLNAVLQPPADTPVFLFAHFFVPHLPSIYDKDGSLRTNTNFPASENMGRYVDQVNYANQLIRQSVEAIQQRDTNSIIIIQGDHGYRQYADRAARPDRFGIMSAIYLPRKQYDAIGNDFLSVNTFRIVLSEYFGRPLPLLKGK